MRQWSSLPSEVLQIAFRYLKCSSPYISNKTDELLECELVCRNWRLPAQLVIYADVYLHTEDQVIKFIDLVANPDQALGKYVKSIYYNNSGHPRTNYMEPLSRHCPFVEEIESSRLDNTFYLRLIQIQKESRWKNLKSVPVPYNDGEYLDSYAKCAIAYQDSLKHLALIDTVENQENREIFPAPFQNLYESLDQFGCLKRLSITDHHSNKIIEDFDDIFEKSVFLEYISMELHPITSTLNNSARLIPVTRSGMINLEHVAPDPYIKTFEGDGAILYSDNSLLYIMHKFSQLKKITLNQNERIYRYSPTVAEKMNNAKYNYSARVIGQFLTFLRQVPLYHLGLFDCVANMASIIEHHLSLPTDMLLPLEIRNEAVSKITDEQAEINMTNINRYRSCKSGGDMIITFWNNGDNLSCLELIQRCGNRMRDLSFHLQEFTLKRFTFEGNAYNIATGYVLDHIFRYCTKLTHLSLYGIKLIRCNYSDRSINTSVKHFKISAALIPNSNLFAEISIRLPSLKFLTLNLCTLGNHAKNGSLFGNNKIKKKKKIITDTLFSFDMVNTAFDTFYIQQNMVTLPQYKFTRLCIEIQQTALPQRYYMVSMNANNMETIINSIDMGRYGASIGDTSCANICIRCKSIAKVKLEWRPLDCEIVL